MRQKYAHTRYTIRTRTRKKCTYTRGQLKHTYTKTEKRRTAAQTCGGLKPCRYDRRGAIKRKCYAAGRSRGEKIRAKTDIFSTS